MTQSYNIITDKHLSLRQTAYLRSALTPGRKNLFEAIHRFPSVAHSGDLQFRVNYRARHTVTHPSRSPDDCCAASRLDGAVFRGPPARAMLGVQHECLQAMCERKLLLGSVATCCSTFGGRPVGLGRLKQRIGLRRWPRCCFEPTGGYSAWQCV